VKLHRTGLLVIATATLGLSAPTAQADTLYAGTGVYKGNQPTQPSFSLLRRDNGEIVARAVLSVRCRGYADYNLVIRLKGSTADGVNFTASGKTKLGPPGSVRITLTGTLAPDAVAASAKVTKPGCKGYTQPVALRTESAPAAAPAVPAAGTVMHGMTSQAAGGGLRLPVSLRVTKAGKVYASWQATMKCGSVTLPVLDLTPSRKIKADGTFGGTQSYTIRYRGHSERYRVTFKGQFLADGVRGTLRARMQYRDGKRSYVPCVSGAQTWAARA
jgi:hypothetical protein